MSRLAVCPDRDTLNRLVCGYLPADEAESLAHHLEECASCVDVVAGLPGTDPLVQTAHGKETLPPDSAAEAELATLVRRMKSLVGTGETPLDLRTLLRPAQESDELGRLGDYRILRVLGSGGMGVVLEAEDVHLRRRVALKVMKPDLITHPKARERVLREAQAIAALQHEHIVSLHHVGEERGVLFLVMPLLQGETLDARLSRGPLDLAAVRRFGEQTALGLAAAHEQGVIHRDVKPGNLWIEATGARIKILDFGLARPVKEAGITRSGTILGTPAYMAPEQAEGKPVDARADLFSLGCVLYQMLTGERPFPGESAMAVLAALASRDPRPIRSLRPDAPADLVALVGRLLQRDPARRPTSALAVAEELRVGRPLPQRTSRRKWAVALLAAALLAGLFAVGDVRRFTTNRGVLKVQIDDPAIKVRVLGKNGVVLIDETTKREFVLTAGVGVIEVLEKDGVSLKTEEFALRRGGKTTVAVTVEPLPAKAPVAAGATERTIAEWILSTGGGLHVALRENGPEIVVTQVADLPREAFRIHNASIGTRHPQPMPASFLEPLRDLPHLASLNLEIAQVTDDALAALDGVPELRYLNLPNSPITSAGLAHLARCTKLHTLTLRNTQIDDAGLAHLGRLKSLERLYLSRTAISDAGLVHLRGLTNLQELGLDVTDVRGPGLKHLAGLPQLTQLLLRACPLAEGSLAALAGHKALTRLDLHSTPLRGEEVAGFKKATPGCKVEPGNPAQDTLLRDALKERKLAEWVLSHHGHVEITSFEDGEIWTVTRAALLPQAPFRLKALGIGSVAGGRPDHFLDPIRNHQHLRSVALSCATDEMLAALVSLPRLTSVSLEGAEHVTSSGLVNLKRMTNLTDLNLRQTKIGDGGLAHLSELTSLVRLSLGQTQVTDAGLHHLRGLKKLDVLSLAWTEVTNAGLNHLRDLTTLSELRLGGTRVSDAGLKELTQLTSLRVLGLTNCPVTDEGLKFLHGLKKLKEVHLGGTGVTAAGREAFAKAVPGCLIELGR